MLFFSPSFVSLSLLKNCSLFTSTTWSWSAEHINSSTKATSSCLTRSWSRCGRLPTTAIAAATSPPLWSSKTQTQESQSCSEQCLTLKGSFHLEQQHLISCKQMKTKWTQPLVQCTDTRFWDSSISGTCVPIWICILHFVYLEHLDISRCQLSVVIPTLTFNAISLQRNDRLSYSEVSTVWLCCWGVLEEGFKCSYL